MSEDHNEVSRRDVLAQGLGSALALVMSRFGMAQTPQKSKEKELFKVGLQSYSFRTYNFEDAVLRSRDIGIHYWESFPDHIPITGEAQKIQKALGILKAADISLLTFGVLSFDKDTAKNRSYFEFAKKMGIQTLSADPDPESLSQLSELVHEFDINIAIHNHGPQDRHGHIAQVQKAMEGQHKRIGACVDTGHYLRSGEDPVTAIKTFGQRVYGLHLKDFLKGTDIEKVTGDGDLDLHGVLVALREVGYTGVLSTEYELDESAPVPGVQRCLANTRAAVAKLA